LFVLGRSATEKKRFRRYEAHRWYLSGGVEENYEVSVSIISDPEPSTSCMQVTAVTDYDKFLNSEVIMRKAV